MSPKLTRLLASGGLLALLLLPGCSGEPPLAPVTGKVTMNGKPLKNVRVDFHPDPDKGTSGKGSTGTTDEGGNFTLVYAGGKPGAVVGHHRVILSDLDVFGTVFVGRGDYRSEDAKGASKEVPIKARFPETYSNLARTPIRQEVRDGLGPVAIEVK